jgi:hypothetical protein
MQDLAVVVLLMLIPLLAPSPDGSQSGGMAKIAKVRGGPQYQLTLAAADLCSTISHVHSQIAKVGRGAPVLSAPSAQIPS